MLNVLRQKEHGDFTYQELERASQEDYSFCVMYKGGIVKFLDREMDNIEEAIEVFEGEFSVENGFIAEGETMSIGLFIGYCFHFIQQCGGRLIFKDEFELQALDMEGTSGAPYNDEDIFLMVGKDIEKMEVSIASLGLQDM